MSLRSMLLSTANQKSKAGKSQPLGSCDADSIKNRQVQSARQEESCLDSQSTAVKESFPEQKPVNSSTGNNVTDNNVTDNDVTDNDAKWLKDLRRWVNAVTALPELPSDHHPLLPKTTSLKDAKRNQDDLNNFNNLMLITLLLMLLFLFRGIGSSWANTFKESIVKILKHHRFSVWFLLKVLTEPLFEQYLKEIAVLHPKCDGHIRKFVDRFKVYCNRLEVDNILYIDLDDLLRYISKRLNYDEQIVLFCYFYKCVVNEYYLCNKETVLARHLDFIVELMHQGPSKSEFLAKYKRRAKTSCSEQDGAESCASDKEGGNCSKNSSKSSTTVDAVSNKKGKKH